MAVCSLFNRMLLLTDLIPVHLLYCGQTVMIGCNHTSFEWTRAVRHIYGIIRHMQGLYSPMGPGSIHSPGAICASGFQSILASAGLLRVLRFSLLHLKLDFLNKSVSKHFMEASLKFDAFAQLGFAWLPPNVIKNK